MFSPVIKKVFGTRNERLIKRMQSIINQINALEVGLQALSDDELRGKTDEFRARLGEGESLDSLLPEAFAVVRETSVRTLGMRHFDVQLLGGIVLHYGKIAEMGTGEGKTLAATLAVYLNALTGRGVHIITVNDYLAKRDAEWMSPVYRFLGLSVGIAVPGMSHQEKCAAYGSDLTYATNNELGFDYLRDNMAFTPEGKAQRELAYVIVDEVDSVLIDEARTPLIISGPVDEDAGLYAKLNGLVGGLKQQEAEDGPGHYSLDEKVKQVYLTEQGHQFVEALFIKQGLLKAGESLYDVQNVSLMHHFNAVMRAHLLFKRDVDYLVKDGTVMIIDEHTGRTMEGRRWSDGLHQAIEAKEGVEIQNENQTLASITFQNYFRLYNKIAGMTGTADTEAQEFFEIYGLEVVVIPPNKPLVREDFSDLVYISEAEKYKAILAAIKERHEKGQPILVGTASIESSELVSQMLKRENITHQVLNAKFHEKEAAIIAQAGKPGAVTIATNMAGRGTDIVLGGNFAVELAEVENPDEALIASKRAAWQKRHDEVIALGGLHVLGTERNESRRIDNQLRGRAGRQGDPGSSRFYLSLEDSLMRIFASDRVAMLMKKLGMQEGEAIEHALVTRAIENAQKKVEGHNFNIRKQLLQYDNVANDQRKVVYQQRDFLIFSEEIADTIRDVREDVVDALMAQYVPPESFSDEWDIPGLEQGLRGDFNLALPVQRWIDEDENVQASTIRERILEAMEKLHQRKEAHCGAFLMRQVEKTIMLQNLDAHWKEHLAAMDHLRQGIHLRSYAQKDPIQEYKRESFLMFTEMLESVKYDAVRVLCVVQINVEEGTKVVESQQARDSDAAELQYHHDAAESSVAQAQASEVAVAAQKPAAAIPLQAVASSKIGRNDTCPCGSGVKYKHCHGV